MFCVKLTSIFFKEEAVDEQHDEKLNAEQAVDDTAEVGVEIMAKKKFDTRKLVIFAVFLALVILLQVFGSFIKIGAVSISLVLIPIVLGGILMGPIAGTCLGFAFGLVTLVAGITGTDPFTAVLFSEHPALTALVCLGKGTCAGLFSALLYKLIAKKSQIAAVFTASAAAPIINTGLFILGALTMQDTFLKNFLTDGMSLLYFLVIVCAGINFIIEFCVNIVASPALISLIKIFNGRKY